MNSFISNVKTFDKFEIGCWCIDNGHKSPYKPNDEKESCHAQIIARYLIENFKEDLENKNIFVVSVKKKILKERNISSHDEWNKTESNFYVGWNVQFCPFKASPLRNFYRTKKPKKREKDTNDIKKYFIVSKKNKK